MKHIPIKWILFLILALVCTSCYQTSSNGYDDLITSPVTNNPNIIPGGGEGGMPY